MQYSRNPVRRDQQRVDQEAGSAQIPRHGAAGREPLHRDRHGNIRYGRLDATDVECIAGAKLANADDFIRRLPDGYQTMLTGNGARLSQG